MNKNCKGYISCLSGEKSVILDDMHNTMSEYILNYSSYILSLVEHSSVMGSTSQSDAPNDPYILQNTI